MPTPKVLPRDSGPAFYRHLPHKLTPEFRRQLATSPEFRLQNLYLIRTKAGQVSPLTFNRAQAEYMKLRTKRDVILKARQLGFTTLKVLQLLDRTIWKPNTTSVILAHKRESVEKIFHVAKFAYDMWPVQLLPKPEAKYDSKHELYFPEINSRIYVTSEVRGDTVNNLHVSEMAFMEDAEERLIASFASVPPGGFVSIESTANGVGNYFYDFYNAAEERGFRPHFYGWNFAPEYSAEPTEPPFTRDERTYQRLYGLTDGQLAWRRATAALYKDKFKQEFPINAQEAFLASGVNVFPLDELDAIAPLPPIIQSDGLFVWKKPEYGRRYVLGVDTSEGTSFDESAIDVLDAESGEQVWHWSGKIPVPLLAEKVEAAARQYNGALVIPEANNHGFALIHMLADRRLDIYRREKFDTMSPKSVEKLGWLTTARTKPIMVQALVTALYERDIRISHRKTLAQMRTFVLDSETGKMAAAPGKRDDCVMSLALAWQGVRKVPARRPPEPEYYSEDFTTTERAGYSAVSY